MTKETIARSRVQKNSFTKVCFEANREIYDLLTIEFDSSMLQKLTAGAGGDISSKADMIAEEILIKHLRQFGTIESEESGIIGSGTPKVIIDPLDGSANFASRFPYYGTSAALLDDNGMLESAQICNLVNGDTFIRDLDGSIAKKNLINDITKDKPHESTCEVGLFEKAYAYPDIVAGLLQKGYKFRSLGATALSLAYARTASFFLFAGESRVYDMVAGLALCEGMEVIVEEDYVIVSQSKTVAEDIERITQRSMR